MASTKSGREFVSYALSIGALELVPAGRKLKSGRWSPYFFNAGLFYTAESTDCLAKSYADVIALANKDNALMPDVIFGPAYKGIVLAAMTARMLWCRWNYPEIAWAHDRKEEKSHGDGGILVGAPLQGKRVIIRRRCDHRRSIQARRRGPHPERRRQAGCLRHRLRPAGTRRRSGGSAALGRAFPGGVQYPGARCCDARRPHRGPGAGAGRSRGRRDAAAHPPLPGRFRFPLEAVPVRFRRAYQPC